MSEPFLCGEWPKANGEVIRVALGEFKGRPTLDLRQWCTGRDEKLHPSKSGITFAAWHLDALKAAVDTAHAEAIRRGLIEASTEHGGAA